MDFDYSEEQLLMQSEARRFLASACNLDVVREVLNSSEKSYSPDLWKQIAEMGWLGAGIPEKYGGLGLGSTELCAIAEELGRALAPVPFSTTQYLFAQALLIAGSEEQKERYLPDVASGELIGSFATVEGPSEVSLDTIVTSTGLTGVKIPVTDGDIARFAVVLATDKGQESLYIIDLTSPGVVRSMLSSLDPTRSIAKLELTDVACELLGELGKGRQLKQHIYDRSAVFVAFEQLGGADAVLDATKSYALERYAFGRPIGSYQALKHRMAHMYVRNQVARSNAYYGAWALDSDTGMLPRAAAAARVAASDAYWFASKESIEIFGGMGTTWEANCHLFYRRAKHLSLLVGQPERWRERLAAELESSLPKVSSECRS